MRLKSISRVISTCAFGVLISADVFAQLNPQPGLNITYGPQASPVPTLSEIALIITALLIAIIGFRVMRANPGNRPLASLFLLGSLSLVLTAVGPQLIDSARANGGYEFDSTSGGTVSINLLFWGGEISNSTDVPQQIFSREFRTSGCSIYDASSSATAPICTVGHVVPSGASCYVEYDCSD